MASRFSIEAVFKAVDRITAPITRMGARIGKVTRGIGDGVQRLNSKFKKFGKAVGPALGVAGVAGALLAVKMAIGAVIAKGAEFEQSLVSAGVRFEEPILRGTAAFEKLSEAAREAGRTTEFTANESALALKFMAKAGFDAGFAVDALPALIDLATASEQDLARASDIVSDSMAAFGMITDDNAQNLRNLTKVSDQMVKATNSANLTFEDMFETIKLGAPLAVAAGVSMDELISITARLAQAGIKGSRGGTVLNQIFTKLVQPKVQKNLRRLGVDALDAQKNMRPFADILDDLADSLSGLSKAQQAGVISQIFDVRGGRGVLSFFTQGSTELRKLNANLLLTNRETEKMAAIMRDTTQGALAEMTSAWASLQLSIFETNAGTEDFADAVTRLVRATDKFIAQNPGLSKFLGFVLLIGGAFLIVGLAVAAVTAAIVFITGSTVALGFAIGGAVIAFLAWIDIIGIAKAGWVQIVSAVEHVWGLMQKIDGRRAVRNFFGLVDSEEETESAAAPGPLGQAERIAREIREGHTRNFLDLRIQDETGRASFDTKPSVPGVNVILEPTGSF